ncbi:hypothetical protein [Escherichia coli]|uniref:hypothetical protein n=1 Tax=Escherichia coli TaxID=562 RepID=UPI000B286D22|nr:hypothetical protein [Escherichia coli]EFC4344978.1 hypothetical protein [Escherichia coli]EFI5742342.1 hypothetical protein [Escherichia coli]EFJ9808750.1 hypothetical protein [Escherichia coli]EFK2140616.1 hypothetical protein [Escherichia coli]EFK4641324.1 hypothetical protein [Escherichia coli]
MIRRVAAHLAPVHNCRMRRERLIRPTGERGFVGMIRRVAAHLAPVHNRRMRRERLIRPTGERGFVGMIRRVCVASGIGAQL